MQRFAPYFKEVFPETVKDNGLIESPLKEIPNMKTALENMYTVKLTGNLFLKMDSHLAVAGSVKARGGIYEVIKHAETLCIENGLIKPTDSYKRFADQDIKDFLSDYSVHVGSTGNLGMSIGIMSAALGFKVITQIVWATGGKMVPENIYEEYFNTYI